MGVSILMTPGPIGRNRGEQVSITPGWRSEAVRILCRHFGEAPLGLDGHDVGILRLLADGASVYASDAENMFKRIADAIDEHSSVTIVMEY